MCKREASRVRNISYADISHISTHTHTDTQDGNDDETEIKTEGWTNKEKLRVNGGRENENGRQGSSVLAFISQLQELKAKVTIKKDWCLEKI